MSKTLKQEVIKALENDKNFDMSTFGEACDLVKNNKKRKNYCGTASCIAGHIVAAGARLGRTVPKILLKNDGYDKKGNHIGDPGAELMSRLGLNDYGTDPVARCARVLWARAYGKESANKLDFFADKFAQGAALIDVTPQQAIDHLNSI